MIVFHAQVGSQHKVKRTNSHFLIMLFAKSGRYFHLDSAKTKNVITRAGGEPLQ